MSSPLVFSGLGLTDSPRISPYASKPFLRNDDQFNARKPQALFFTEAIEEVEEKEKSKSKSKSSSIGEDEGSSDGEEEVQSKRNDDGVFSFSSLESIEDSLPIKRGLSRYYSGKSRSFASLADMESGAGTAADLAKPENPLNKRRRILMASKIRRASNYSACGTIFEEGDDEDEEKRGESSVASENSDF